MTSITSLTRKGNLKLAYVANFHSIMQHAVIYWGKLNIQRCVL